MGIFADKHKELEREISNRIIALIAEKGVESKSRGSSCRVLRIPDEQQFNIEGGRFVTEITDTELIDNCGYSYFHSTLELEQLCEIIDNL